MNLPTPTTALMPTHDDSGNIASVDVQHLIERIDELLPGKQRQKTAQFQKLYPAIERALGRDVPQKTVVAQLANMGLPVSMGGFRSLLEAERRQRIERGECAHCKHCGSVLPASIDTSCTSTLAGLIPKNPALRESGD